MNHHEERLQRLEARLRPIGCDTCRHWDSTPVVCGPDDMHCMRGQTWVDVEDGKINEACPQCGRHVVSPATVTLVGVDVGLI